MTELAFISVGFIIGYVIGNLRGWEEGWEDCDETHKHLDELFGGR